MVAVAVVEVITVLQPLAVAVVAAMVVTAVAVQE
jgi:hypothetical protein